MAAKSQKRIYKVINHSTGTVTLVNAYNAWQATAYAVRDDVVCEVCSTDDAVKMTIEGAKVADAVQVKKTSEKI